MKMRHVFALASLAAFAACGSASDAVTFQAPPGYTQAASLGPFMQIWNTSDKQNIMMLMALPTKIDLNKAMSQADIQDAVVKVKKRITICGNQEAIYADLIGESKSAASGQVPRKMDIEFLATNVHDKTYMAIYMRPVGAPLNPAADAVIHNVCPK